MFNKLHMLFNRYGPIGKYSDAVKPSKNNICYEQEIIENLIKNPYAFRQVSEELCKKAVMDAKTQLHPLLQQVDLEKLGHRREFVQAFKYALGGSVAA